MQKADKKEEKGIFSTKMEKFFDKIGMPLTALSIFLTVLFEMLKSPYIDNTNAYLPFLLALLFGLIITIGIHIFNVSQEFDYLPITLVGIAVVVIPFLFYGTISPDLENKVSGGGFILVLLLCLIAGYTFVNKIYTNIKSKFSSWFDYVCIIISVALFIIIKFTSWLIPFWKFLLSGSMTWYATAIITGLKVGIIMGIIIVPIVKKLNDIIGEDQDLYTVLKKKLSKKGKSERYERTNRSYFTLKT